MNSLKAVVFDFDGTLADSFPLIFAGFAHAFSTVHQRDPNQAELDAMLGPTETDAIRGLSDDCEIGNRAVSAFFDFFQAQHNSLCAVEPEIETLLQLLEAQGIPLALFSGRSERCLHLSAELMFGANRFAIALGGDSVARTKPAPDGLLKAAAHLGVDPSEVIYVGDTDGDITLAKAAGSCAVRAAWFPTIGHVACDAQADHQFDSIPAFMQFLQTKINQTQHRPDT